MDDVRSVAAAVYAASEHDEEYTPPPETAEAEDSLVPGPPDPHPYIPDDWSGQNEKRSYGGVNVLNYTEQGGARTVIGGELAFEEGAQVSGFPSGAAYFDLDLNGVELNDCVAEAVSVSDRLPLDTFVELTEGKRPVLFRNGVLGDRQISVMSCSAQFQDYIVGLCPILVDLNGLIDSIGTFLLYVEGDRVMFRFNPNGRKIAIEDPPKEAVKLAEEEARVQ